MKPANALLIGAGIMIALYYGRRAASLFSGDVQAVPTGFTSFKIVGSYLQGAVLVRITNNGPVSFNVKSIQGTVYVNSMPLIDVAALDPFIIQPGGQVEVAVELSVPISSTAAMTVVQLVTGIITKKVSLTFDGQVNAEGLTLPIKKTVSYG